MFRTMGSSFDGEATKALGRAAMELLAKPETLARCREDRCSMALAFRIAKKDKRKRGRRMPTTRGAEV